MPVDEEDAAVVVAAVVEPELVVVDADDDDVIDDVVDDAELTFVDVGLPLVDVGPPVDVMLVDLAPPSPPPPVDPPSSPQPMIATDDAARQRKPQTPSSDRPMRATVSRRRYELVEKGVLQRSDVRRLLVRLDEDERVEILP